MHIAEISELLLNFSLRIRSASNKKLLLLNNKNLFPPILSTPTYLLKIYS